MVQFGSAQNRLFCLYQYIGFPSIILIMAFCIPVRHSTGAFRWMDGGVDVCVIQVLVDSLLGGDIVHCSYLSYLKVIIAVYTTLRVFDI